MASGANKQAHDSAAAQKAKELLERYDEDAMDVAAQHFHTKIRMEDVRAASDWLAVMQELHHEANPPKRKYQA